MSRGYTFLWFALVVSVLVTAWVTWPPPQGWSPLGKSEVVLPAVVAEMLEDYHPEDAVRPVGPEDYDSTLEWALDRYLVMKHQLADTVTVMDSLRLRLARCESRP